LAIIRLQLRQINSAAAFPKTFINEDGKVAHLQRLRLMSQILIGPDPAKDHKDADTNDRRRSFPAVLDTGAMISIFPRHIWEEFEPQITRLSLNPDEVDARPPARRTPMCNLLGRRFPYFLGRIWVGAYDLENRRMPSARILAMFREDVIGSRESQPPIVLGLRHGILDNRHFFREPICDAHEPGGRTFEQRWWLVDYAR
jgi:hypothetical protein